MGLVGLLAVAGAHGSYLAVGGAAANLGLSGGPYRHRERVIRRLESLKASLAAGMAPSPGSTVTPPPFSRPLISSSFLIFLDFSLEFVDFLGLVWSPIDGMV